MPPLISPDSRSPRRDDDGDNGNGDGSGGGDDDNVLQEGSEPEEAENSSRDQSGDHDENFVGNNAGGGGGDSDTGRSQDSLSSHGPEGGAGRPLEAAELGISHAGGDAVLSGNGSDAGNTKRTVVCVCVLFFGNDSVH